MKLDYLKSLLLTLLLIFSGCTIEGEVKNENGEAVVGASVVATDGNSTQTVTTDTVGYYVIDEFSQGSEVSLLVSEPNYLTQEKKATVSNETSYVDFTLVKKVPQNTKALLARLVDEQGNPIINASGKLLNNGKLMGEFVTQKNGGVSLDRANAVSWFEFNDTIVMELHMGDISKKFGKTQRSFLVSNYVDKSNLVNFGDVILKYTTLKGCAKKLDGSALGKDIYDDASEFREGVFIDEITGNHFSQTIAKGLYDDDNGSFEFKVFRDGLTHSLTVYDKDGNTNSWPFNADMALVDFGDNCIKVEPQREEELNFDITIDSDITVNAFRIIQRNQNSKQEILIDTTKISSKHYTFTLSKNATYYIYIDAPNSEDALKNLNLTLSNGVRTLKEKTTYTLVNPDTQDKIHYIHIFGIYQARIVSLDLE